MALNPPDLLKTLGDLRGVKAHLDALVAAHPASPQADRTLPKLGAALAGVEIAIVALESLESSA